MYPYGKAASEASKFSLALLIKLLNELDWCCQPSFRDHLQILDLIRAEFDDCKSFETIKYERNDLKRLNNSSSLTLAKCRESLANVNNTTNRTHSMLAMFEMALRGLCAGDSKQEAKYVRMLDERCTRLMHDIYEAHDEHERLQLRAKRTSLLRKHLKHRLRLVVILIVCIFLFVILIEGLISLLRSSGETSSEIKPIFSVGILPDHHEISNSTAADNDELLLTTTQQMMVTVEDMPDHYFD